MVAPRLTDEQLRSTYLILREADFNVCKAARDANMPRPSMQYRTEEIWRRWPFLKPGERVAEPPPDAPRQQGNDNAPGVSAMAVHRAEQARIAAKAEASELREQIVDLERKLSTVMALRDARPDALNWTLAAPAIGKKTTLMPCLMLSDFQAGEVIRPGELDGMNTYNTDIFLERYYKAIEKTIEFATRHVGSAEFPGCMYWNLGDVISGGIHDDLAQTDDLASVPAIRAIFQAEREGIKQMRAKFGRVHVVRVNGNHDRTTPKPRSKNQAGLSFGTLLSWWLQTAFEGDPKVTFQVPSSVDAMVRVFNWNVVLTHGDKMGSSGGKGFIGTESAILRGHHQMFKNWSDGGHIPDLICSGHFHTLTSTVRGYGNGSLAGYSQYPRDLRAIPDAARQWLLFMHDREKVAYEFKLRLSEWPKRTMLEHAA